MMAGPSEFIKRTRQLRDDVTVEVFGTFGQTNREASMALAKLDEAESWLIRWGIQSGSHILVDKSEYVRALEASENYGKAAIDSEDNIWTAADQSLNVASENHQIDATDATVEKGSANVQS